MKKLILSLFITTFALSTCLATQPQDSLTNETYANEIKLLFEDHYGKEFNSSPEMKTACINYIERKINGDGETTYRDCNYFITRSFPKSAYESNDLISLKDVLFADFRLEFVEKVLNNPEFEFPDADKIHVEVGEHKEYVYVVVGISSTWYENNPDKVVYVD